MNESNRRLLTTLAVLQVATLGLLFVMIFFPSSATLSRPPVESAGNAQSDLIAMEPADISMTAMRHEAIALSEFKAAFREVLRDELEVFVNQLRAADVAPREVSPQTVLSGDDPYAREEAAAMSAAVVQQALSAGVWTVNDTQALLPHLARLSEGQRLELLDRFYTAINRQQLALEDVPPL